MESPDYMSRSIALRKRYPDEMTDRESKSSGGEAEQELSSSRMPDRGSGEDRDSSTNSEQGDIAQKQASNQCDSVPRNLERHTAIHALEPRPDTRLQKT